MMEPQILKPQVVHLDERGRILRLLEKPINQVSLIYTRNQAVRGNHYHKEDTQVLYVLQGYAVVTTKQVETGAEKRYTIYAGDLEIMPPLWAHRYLHYGRCKMMQFATRPRVPDTVEDTYAFKLE